MASAQRRVGATTLCAALLLALSAPYVSAQTGAISGTVTREGGTGIQSVTVNAYLNGTGFPYGATTSAAGTYTISSLSPGTYYVVTLSFLDVVDELYPNTPCPDTLCPLTSGGQVVVSSGTTTANINFTLAAGPVITGTITNAANGAYLQGVTARAYDIHGNNMGSMPSNVYGVYQLHAVPAGTYFVRTFASGYLNELYDNIPCSPSCTVTNGTPIIGVAEMSNIADFALTPLSGVISGTVSDAVSHVGLSQVTVVVYNASGGYVDSGSANSGSYSVAGLSPGTYYARTYGYGDSGRYFDELYDNITCNAYVHVCSITSGTPIVVTLNATSTANFALTLGGRIHGVVSSSDTGLPLNNVTVTVYNATGSAAQGYTTGSNGVYETAALPAGHYYAYTTNSQGYVNELYDNLPCLFECAPLLGTPFNVISGLTMWGLDFALAQGGRFRGTVSDAVTGLPVGGVVVGVFDGPGNLLGNTGTDGFGIYQTPALPAGMYFARTMVSDYLNYADEVFRNLPCLSDCTPSAGTPIVLSTGTITSLVDFSLAPNLVQNGHFNSGTTNWSIWATPDASYMVSSVVNGVFEYYRVPPPAQTSNQAVIFQNTGVAVDAASPLVSQFDIGNSSDVRRRISVLLLDGDFTDLSVCTFWLEPHAPLRHYRMFTHTTKTWTNASIYFYAASAGSDGGAYRLDNVLVYRDPNESSTQTRCVDPTRPLPPGGADGPTLLTNGDFETGTLTPWSTYGTITTQVTGGVLEFIRPSSTPPAGVVLQATNAGMGAQQLMTASFRLGNSSGVRKRVTVLLHDLDFTDLAACTFWLAPSQSLATYAMRTFATQAWLNATLSVYPATTDVAGWIRFDDAALRLTPGATISGTDCVEPAAITTLPTLSGAGSAALANPVARAVPSASARTAADAGTRRLQPLGWTQESDDAWTQALADGLVVVEYLEGVDLHGATRASLRFTSELGESVSGEVQVRVDDGEWLPLYLARATAEPEEIEIDLAGLTGGMLDIRFVRATATGAVEADDAAHWDVSDLSVEVN